ncbi:hemolysin III family protein [Corticibacter populi]|uniref:Hemolysin III family protein n=1 Tax=Corticibacter populi TaxID=1550736 RepID=A0A3M6QQW6_9BURK|nr:hemolysin III family protein [Corticibacter populi]RMX04949.1 hemolysin III family protein [Corticibacter populi]RZS33625.1 hemolysin III [Corticibacter populi]
MKVIQRNQTFGEELANAITHGIGCALAIAALPILSINAAQHGSAHDVVGASIFGSTMILMYLASTIYHALPAGRVKAWMNRADHAAIYIFIAGSYTPFTLGLLRGSWGWSLFGLVWTIAAIGVVLKLLQRLNSPLLSTGLYLLMGWLILAATGQLLEKMPTAGLLWLLAGGLSYSVGAVVFIFDSRFKYAHCFWHLFVIGGTVCHFFAALRYGY